MICQWDLLFLVRNSCVEKELNHKTKAQYLGPMVVVHWTKGGAYVMAEMDRAVLKLRYATFRIVPYLPQSLRAFW